MIVKMRKTALLLMTLMVAFSTLGFTTVEGKLILGDQEKKILLNAGTGGMDMHISDLAELLGAGIGRDPLSQAWVLEINGSRLVLSPNQAAFALDGKISTMSRRPIPDGNDLWVPVEGAKAMVARLGLGPLEFKNNTLSTGSGQKKSLHYAVFPAADSLKVVITGESDFDADVKVDNKVLSVTLKNGSLVPVQERYASSLISRVKGQGPTLDLSLGKGYRDFRRYNLSNPPRLVLVIMGQETAPLEGRLVAPSSGVGEVAPPDSAGPQFGESREPRSNPYVNPWRRDGFIRTVVIDPGHGGQDEGAGRNGLKEKELTLALAKSLRRALEKRAGVNVILTRSSDISVGLEERASMANYNGADLFISLHVNSSNAKMSHGSETYYLSLDASDEASAAAARRENAAGGVKISPLDFVLWDLAQREYLEESALISELIQNNLNELLGTKSRGVKQAPFVVLKGVQAPAILVEVAFLSNPKEAALLEKAEFKGQVVEALTRAVITFKSRVESVRRAPVSK